MELMPLTIYQFLNILQTLIQAKIESSGGASLQSHIHDTTMTTLQYPNNVVGHIFV